MTPEEHAQKIRENYGLEWINKLDPIWEDIATAIHEHETEVRQSYREGWRAAFGRAEEEVARGERSALDWDGIEKELKKELG